jgi:drug/metabolite transporter (DMT)-like permease
MSTPAPRDTAAASPAAAPAPQSFSRWVAIGILLSLGLLFASNHIFARVAFDHGTGLATAVLVRSALTVLGLLAVVLILRTPWQLRHYAIEPRWLYVLGALIAVQSLFLYSSVARIPVGLALLVFNLFPALFTLLNWALGGPRPSVKTLGIIGLVLLGLALALDLPAQLAKTDVSAGVSAGVADTKFWIGVACGFAAASIFAVALRVTEFKLKPLSGTVRSLWTMGLTTLFLGTVCLAVLLGLAGEGAQSWAQASLHWPSSALGWLGLAGLTLCYGLAFSLFFALIPKLNMQRNAPAANIEPVAALVLGWIFLGQQLSLIQLLGAGVVMLGIVLLALMKK